MSSPPSSEGDPPDGGKKNSSSKNDAVAANAEAAGGDDEMEDIKQFVIRSSQNLKSDSSEAGDVEEALRPSPSSSTSTQFKVEVKKEEEVRDERERGLPPPLPQPKMYVMPKTTAAMAAEKSPASSSTLSGQLPPPATRQITIRAPTVQKAGIGPKIHLQQNIQVSCKMLYFKWTTRRQEKLLTIR